MAENEEFQMFTESIRSGSVELFHKYFKEEFLEREGIERVRPIHHACSAGHIDIVKLLIDHNCDIEAIDALGLRPIHHACRIGHTEIVKLLIDHFCDIEALDALRLRPIHHACRVGHTEIVKLLIDHYCDIEACDESGWRPIHHATNKGQTGIVKLLIDCHCDIESRDNWWNRMPIHHACSVGHIEIVKLLIDHHCDVEARDNSGWRPIHHACKEKFIDIIKLLIDHHCDIEAGDEWKRRPIHYACREEYIELVKLLIDHHCNIEASDKSGWRPIHYACMARHIEIVKLLIDYHCDIEALDRWKRRPIHYACSADHKEAVKLLITHHCDIEAFDEWGWRPIHHACHVGSIETVNLLIDYHCDIGALDKSGNSPIEIAVRYGNEEIIHVLIGPCLLLACKNGDLEKVSKFLNGSTIEYCDKVQRRPIHWACESGNIELVKLLIKRKCKITIKDKSDLSPLDIARRNDNKELVQIIKDAILVQEPERELELERQEQVEKLIVAMGLKCTAFCDHRLCPTSLRNLSFEKGSKIGIGSCGMIYKCKGSGTDKVFAVKRTVLYDISQKYVEGNIYKFLPKLNHQRIIKYFGAILMDDRLCIFMEYFSEGTLEDEIKRKIFLTRENIIRYSKQILEGLEFLHGNSIIHRDIKPSNIMMTSDNDIKLADFGISRSLLRTNGLATRPATIVGTLNFIAPEVILASDDGAPYTESADIWSMGATVINMITGKPPYYNSITPALIFKIASTKKLELPNSQLMSEEMKEFIEEMLNPDPDKRSTAKNLLTLKLFSEFC